MQVPDPFSGLTKSEKVYLWRLERIRRGICPWCGRRVDGKGKRYCSRCREKLRFYLQRYLERRGMTHSEYTRMYREKWRREGRCILCGAPMRGDSRATCTNCSTKICERRRLGCVY